MDISYSISTPHLLPDEYDELNNSLNNLTKQLCAQYSCNTVRNKVIRVKEYKEIIMSKIKDIICNVLKDINENRNPVLILPDKRSWNNCIFTNVLHRKPIDECKKTFIKLYDKKSLSKFSLICFLLGKIFELLVSEEVCTKREIYYQNIEVINSQNMVDNALNEISWLLDVPLHALNIHSSSKGLIYGQVILKTSSEETDCSVSNGTLIPSNVTDIIDIKTEAKFVLLIEKDASFQKLLDNEIMQILPTCIFITGKGFPDVNTRMLLKMIWDILSIPILALFDPDPWGVEIMCIYRFGSLAMSHQGDLLAVPSIRWLGIYPSELDKLCDTVSTLTVRDKSKLKDLLQRPYVIAFERIKQEVEIMLNKNLKAEIEDADICIGFLANKYIPNKIIIGDLI